MVNSRGTEIKINDYINYNIIYGTIDKNQPKSLYIKITGWGNPKNYTEERDYKLIIKRLNKRITKFIYNEIDDKVFIKEKTMTDFDMRDSGIINTKSSFMNCEITLYQVESYLINSYEITESLNILSKSLIENVLNTNEFFRFFKNKKDANQEIKKPIR